MIHYRTRQGDRLDQLCVQHYGQARGRVEQVLAVNPGLAALGIEYDSGHRIDFPAITPNALPANTKHQTTDPHSIRLWS